MEVEGSMRGRTNGRGPPSLARSLADRLRRRREAGSPGGSGGAEAERGRAAKVRDAYQRGIEGWLHVPTPTLSKRWIRMFPRQPFVGNTFHGRTRMLAPNAGPARVLAARSRTRRPFVSGAAVAAAGCAL